MAGTAPFENVAARTQCSDYLEHLENKNNKFYSLHILLCSIMNMNNTMYVYMYSRLTSRNKISDSHIFENKYFALCKPARPSLGIKRLSP